MRKLTLVFVAGLLASLSCNKSSEPVIENNQPEIQMATGRRTCASNDVLGEQLRANPSLRKSMDDIETFTRRMADNPAESARLLAGGTIEIPVVVNVLYHTAAENISRAQIQSQIDVLNEDYGATNNDYNCTPAIFQGLRAGKLNIHFVLSQVNRKSTNKKSWGTNDAMKSDAKGIAPTNPRRKLNLWSCNLAGDILGYAQFPGGKAATDGVVIDDNAFGRTGTATAPFNKGRTATHEVGHWMNLIHIWGDEVCGNDKVADTPQANDPNFGCPSFPLRSTCTGKLIEMTMNYMDYTDDACMFMFTAGQKKRMLAVFAAGGPRAGFAKQ